jgi:hypothetical protein
VQALVRSLLTYPNFPTKTSYHPGINLSFAALLLSRGCSVLIADLSASRSPETHGRPQRDRARKTASHLPQDRCNRLAAIIPHVRNRHQRIRQHRHCVSRRRHLRPALVKLLAPTGRALGPKQRLSEVCKSRYQPHTPHPSNVTRSIALSESASRHRQSQPEQPQKSGLDIQHSGPERKPQHAAVRRGQTRM